MSGIDYGLGRTNIDHVTGIRYGAISQHDVIQAWGDSSEPVYGDPACPKCGDSVADTSGHGDNDYDQYGRGCADYVCHTCKHTLDSADVFPEEPLGWSYSGDGYRLVDCLDSDIMILDSPYYTYAEFCSPCVPGAGNLNGYHADGAKTYCLGHDWFDDNKAPYPIYRVSDDAIVGVGL